NPDLFPVIQKELADYPHAREFASLDGNCFFKAALENPNLWDRLADSAPDTEILRKKLVSKLGELAEPSSPFYAMLLMDGDRLGALLQEHADKTKFISRSLNQFSLQVPSLIEEGNGITVFAGGDDVLALLPLENALTTAIKLRSFYLKAFTNNQIPRATISGAIVYAHFNTPLTEVYHEAQQLLSNEAKDKTGRDSLAVTVWKSAGKVLTWSAPWKIIIDKFMNFLQYFQKDLPGEKKLKEFNSSFFYNIQSRLALFFEKESNLSAFSIQDVQDLLTAEYVKSRGPETDREKAKETMGRLFELCRRYWRNQEGKICTDEKRMHLDSLFLTKFLVEKGVE
ncbi:MAG TPA: type III-B CRISPR-associated protein Cas10/Cmr2, partial [Firmicutes bacterium]|nr:type III-B CRISPR-associated protein Cas10/Cmr2 [Bacillota bacterium]